MNLGFKKFNEQIHASFYKNWILFHRYQRFNCDTPIHELDEQLSELFDELIEYPDSCLEAQWNNRQKELHVYFRKAGISYPIKKRGKL